MLILIRGLPGSGKSTLAHKLVGHYLSSHTPVTHYEADMYFCHGTEGRYEFDPSQLGNAHKWCQQQAEEALADKAWKERVVIVSNTFTQLWEMEPYMKAAEKYGHDVHVIRCTGDFGSIHGVPEKTLERMRARFEPCLGEAYYDGKEGSKWLMV